MQLSARSYSHRSLILALTFVILIIFSVVFWSNQLAKTTTKQVVSASENSSQLNCDASLASGDQLAILLNQPTDNNSVCLFVGCNSFF